VAGERRLRAAVQAGWTRVPVRLVQADDQQLAELALVENLHRKDLNPLEKAASFQRYIREFKVTQEQLASRLKLDRSTIANFIRLLELPAPVQQALRDGRISQAHARALLSLGDERLQIAYCERIQKEGWSVRQTEAMVKKALAEQQEAEGDYLRLLSAEPPPRATRGQSQHLAALEREFRIALGTDVQIISNARGRGRLIIHFRTHEEFERIRRLICEEQPLPKVKAG
jgi:ParB family chromosome partitioning protein